MHSAPAEAANAAATTPAAMLQAVSDPIRLRILRLTAGEELAVQELARILGPSIILPRRSLAKPRPVEVIIIPARTTMFWSKA